MVERSSWKTRSSRRIISWEVKTKSVEVEITSFFRGIISKIWIHQVTTVAKKKREYNTNPNQVASNLGIYLWQVVQRPWHLNFRRGLTTTLQRFLKGATGATPAPLRDHSKTTLPWTEMNVVRRKRESLMGLLFLFKLLLIFWKILTVIKSKYINICVYMHMIRMSNICIIICIIIIIIIIIIINRGMSRSRFINHLHRASAASLLCIFRISWAIASLWTVDSSNRPGRWVVYQVCVTQVSCVSWHLFSDL